MPEDVDVVRQVYQRFREGDVIGAFTDFHPECTVEFIGPPEIPYAGRYTGADGMVEALGRLLDTCEILSFVPESFHAAPDLVTVLARQHCRCKATGAEWHSRMVETYVVRDGAIREFLSVYDTAAVVGAFAGSSPG